MTPVSIRRHPCQGLGQDGAINPKAVSEALHGKLTTMASMHAIRNGCYQNRRI